MRASPFLHSLLSALALFGAAPARAQTSDVAALLRRGVELRREHRNEEARAVFARAVAQTDAPPARAQLGLAEQALGLWVEAERDLDAALAHPEDPWIAKNEAAVKEARAVLEGHLAWLRVDVDVPSAEVRLDGQAVSCAQDVRVVAGTGTLDVRAPGYAAENRRVDLPAGEHVRMEVALTPQVASPVSASPPPGIVAPGIVAPAPDPAETRSSGARSPSVGPITLGIGGLLGLGTGAYFGIRTFDYKADRDAQCVGGCKPAALGYDAQARSAATTSTFAFGAGVALAAAGVTWWLLERAAPRTAHAPVQIAPTVGTVNGLVVRGSL